MTVKRERCTVTTLIDGEQIEKKTSKILVHRCEECNDIIKSFDANSVAARCQICNKELCEAHRIPAPYIDIHNHYSWESKERNICAVCSKTYADDLKNLELADAAYRSANLTHKACCDAGDEARKTLLHKYWRNQKEPQPEEYLTYGERVR